MNKNSGTNKEKWFPVNWNENILCPSTLFIERKFNVWIPMKVNSFFGETKNEKRERCFQLCMVILYAGTCSILSAGSDLFIQLYS